jgi:hypothetical protein
MSWRWSLAMLAGAACLQACSPTDVTVATIPSEDEAGAPIRCVSSSDCPIGFYCSYTTCDATSGTCLSPPTETDCPNTEEPVCGCPDGVTYFNDCLRQSRGTASSTEGPCFAETLCGPGIGECEGGSSCALLAETCQPGLPGSCWVLPQQCPTSPPHGPTIWDSCQPGGSHCVDTCDAIQTGMPFKRAPECH